MSRASHARARTIHRMPPTSARIPVCLQEHKPRPQHPRPLGRDGRTCVLKATSTPGALVHRSSKGLAECRRERGCGSTAGTQHRHKQPPHEPLAATGRERRSQTGTEANHPHSTPGPPQPSQQHVPWHQLAMQQQNRQTTQHKQTAPSAMPTRLCLHSCRRVEGSLPSLARHHRSSAMRVPSTAGPHTFRR